MSDDGASARPAPAGKRVATGRLRVDAARAVDKLRAYQLPDPSMWALEVVRAATLAGATRIRAYGDADDVAIAWDGPPIDPRDLERLFDELVDPAPAADRRYLRLLATGVNTALGLDPRWVDVISCEGEGRARAVRYTPRLLERGEDGTARGLRELAAEERAPGPLAPARGVLVHVRRPPLLGALPILIGLGEPAELSWLRRCAADVRVPLEIGRAVLGRERSHGDLLRVALGEGLDGFLALTDPSFASSEPRLDVAELGVVLARYALPIDGLEEPRAKVPLRLFVDAERMPTNASRSAVRIEDPPVSNALAIVHERLEVLVDRLAAELSGEGTHAWTPHRRERLRAAALVLLAAPIAGRYWRDDLSAIEEAGAYGRSVAKLAALPLVRDALGRPRAPASFARHAGVEHVHAAVDPVPEEAEPWLGEVLWAPPGDPAAFLVGAWRPVPSSVLLRRVRRHRGAREAWLRQRPRAPEVAEAPGQLLAVPIAAPPESFESCAPRYAFALAAGAKGQLVLCDPRSTRAGSVVLRLEGRALERVSIELPVPIVAEVEHPALRPTVDHRGAERDGVLDAVLGAVRASAIVACEALARRMGGGVEHGDGAELRAAWIAGPTEPDRLAVAQLVRGAIELAVFLAPLGALDELRASRSPLLDAAAWPVLGGAWRSLRDILDEAKREPHAIAYARTARGRAPEGARAVHVLSDREAKVIDALVTPAALVDYGPALADGGAGSAFELARALAVRGSAALVVRHADGAAVIAWSDALPELEVRHFGRTLARKTLSFDEPIRVVVDDERIVPNERWTAIRGDVPAYPIDEWRRALCLAYADALAGAPPDELVVGATSPADAELARRCFLRAIADHPLDPPQWLGAERAAAVLRAPLARVLGEDEPTSLASIAEAFAEEPIPFLPPEVVPSYLFEGWRPLRASPFELLAFTRLLGRMLTDARDDLERRRRAAARADALERLRRQPEVRPAEHWPDALRLDGSAFRSAHVALAASPERGAEIVVCIEGRRYMTMDRPDALPLRLAIDFGQAAADENFRGLTRAALSTIDRSLLRGARAILRKLASERPAALLAVPAAFALLRAWALRPTADERDAKLRELLASAPVFETVQGGIAALAEAAAEDGTLRAAALAGPWLGPVEGERESDYDRAVLRVPEDEKERAEALALLSALWKRGPVRDATGAVTRLQTERRVARGLVQAPRLSRVKDPRFRFSLDDLLAGDAEALQALGLGEAALDDGTRTILQLFDGGAAPRTVELSLVPPVAVACSSPLVRRGEPIDESVRERLVAAVRSVVERLVGRVVDATPPDELPEWTRRKLRASYLYDGAMHQERLAATPLFETTSGAWLTPNDLRAQSERFGSVWWTGDLGCRLVPLDENRVALRLDPSEAALLSSRVPLSDARRELELDAVARANRDRPPVESLEPTPEEHALALSVVAIEPEAGDPSHGIVMILPPGRSSRRGMHVHREMRPLGVVADPSHWPALARVEHPDLVPNRTFDAPIEDGALGRLRERVRKAVDAELARLLPSPGRERIGLRLRAIPPGELGLPDGAIVEGVAYLEDDPGTPGTVAVRDAAGASTLTPTDLVHPLPLSGTVWLDGATFVSSRSLTGIYRRLLCFAADRVSERPGADDPVAAHLARGIGYLEPSWVPPIALPCFAPAPWPLRALVEHLRKGGFVHVAPTDAAARAAALSGGEPILVDDGSLLARQLVIGLGVRALAWKDVLRTRVLSEEPPSPGPVLGGAAEAAGEGPALASRVAGRDARKSALELAVADALACADLPGVTEVQLHPESAPLVQVAGRRLLLAARSPIAPLDRGDARVAALLVARAAGALHRVAKRIDEAGELEAIARLLDAAGAW